MSTPLNEIFNVVFGNVFLVYLFSIFFVGKCDFLKVVKIHYPKNRFLVNLRSFLSTNDYFSRRGCIFVLVHSKRSFFKRKYVLSSWSQKKVVQFSAKIPILAIFEYLGPSSKSIFSTYRRSFKKSSVSFLGHVVRNNVSIFGLSILKKVREGALVVLQVDIFQNPGF